MPDDGMAPRELRDYIAGVPSAVPAIRESGHELSESPWESLSGQIPLGTDAFVQRAKALLGGKTELSEIPRPQRHVGRPSLKELFPPGTVTQKQERYRVIRLACGTHGYTLKAISRALGIHYTTVSKVINSASD